MPATQTAPNPSRPQPVTNLRCRRCGGRDHVFVPAAGHVRCVDCASARAVDAMVRTLTRKGAAR